MPHPSQTQVSKQGALFGSGKLTVPGKGLLLIVIGVLFALASLQNAATNDNLVAAGHLTRSELRVSLDARVALWHPDDAAGPGIPIETFAENGKTPQIPGPLIRVRAGTIVIASVRNSIPNTTLTLHGMISRPAIRDRAIAIPFGTTRLVRFRASAPGTYLYWASTTGKDIANRFGADSQLSGALVIDPAGTKNVPADRIFVINEWINVTSKRGSPNFNYELDTINGKSWPYTERLSYAQNSTVRWRWLNASIGTHPLHLHGFYFSVASRGDGVMDDLYARRSDPEVTEPIAPGQTFTMVWHADRPGHWLFHCHFPYHVMRHAPIAAMLAKSPVHAGDDFMSRMGMGGLVLALTVQPSKELGIADPPAKRHVRLTVERAPDDRADTPSFRYLVNEDGQTRTEPGAIGPPIFLTRGQAASIDVTNLLDEPTSVHWHGMELQDSYYDGVPGFSGFGNHRAQLIAPGATFEARMTPPRAGTFIYHTHADDVWQLQGGLVGPLIVLKPGRTFDPNTDHIFSMTTTHAFSLNMLVNGLPQPPALTIHVGVLQRFRFLSMLTIFPDALVSLSAANHTLQWSPLAVDGADVALDHRVPKSAVETITIGQTKDFTFLPTRRGELVLQFWPDESLPRNVVTVPVHVI